MRRPNIDEYFLGMAMVASLRSTCRRRQVGAIAVSKENYILSTGYNGVPAGAPHCTDEPCGGVDHASGEGLDACESIHAEVNAIAHCHNPQDIHTLYITTSPCMSCMKMIIATGCRRIVAKDIYDDSAINYFEFNGGETAIQSIEF